MVRVIRERERSKADQSIKGTKKRRKEEESNEDLTEAEIKEKERLRQLIMKRKKENEEKIRKDFKNQLFSLPDEKSGRKLPKCSICKKERVKKEGTIYCSFDCIQNHIRVCRKKALKAIVGEKVTGNEPEAGEKKEETGKKKELEVGEKKELEEKKVSEEKNDEKTGVSSEESAVKSEQPVKMESTEQLAEEPVKAEPTTESTELKTEIAAVSKNTEPKLEPTITSTSAPESAEPSAEPSATKEGGQADKVAKQPSVSLQDIELPLFDAFNDKDIDLIKDSKGNDRKKLKGKELVKYIISHPNFCCDPRIKVIPLKVSKVSNVPKELSKQGHLESKQGNQESKTPRSNSIQSDVKKEKDRKRSVREIASSRSGKESKALESKTPESKTPTKLRSNSKSESRDEDIVKTMRNKVEEMIHSTLKTRITCDESVKSDLKKKLESSAKTLSEEIELQLFTLCTSTNNTFNDLTKKMYNHKSRMLIFNLKNTKNTFLFHSLFTDLVQISNDQNSSNRAPSDQKSDLKAPNESKSPKDTSEKDTSEKNTSEKNTSEKKLELIKPADLVRMSSEELAKGTELDAWRKEELKKSLDEVIKIEEEKSLIKKTKKGDEEISSKIDTSSSKIDTSSSDLTSSSVRRSPSAQRSPEKVIVNPLDMILKDIDSINSRKKVDKVSEEVPKSPERSPSHFTSYDTTFNRKSGHSDRKSGHSDRKPGHSDRKRVKSGPKVVTVTPSLPSNIVIKETSTGGVQIRVVDTSSSPLGESLRIGNGLNWCGTCSGFEETASSFDPGNSKFGLIISSSTIANEESIISIMRKDRSILPFNHLNVIGRIAPEQVASYVDKLVSLRDGSTPESSFSINQLVQLIPLELKSNETSYANESSYANETSYANESSYA